MLLPKRLIPINLGFSPETPDTLGTTFAAPLASGSAHKVLITSTEIVDERAGY